MEIIINGKQYSSSLRDGGVRAKRHIVDINAWEYVTVKVNENRLQDFNIFFELTKDLKYDWPDIFGFIIPFSDVESKYFCSEWCSKAGIYFRY